MGKCLTIGDGKGHNSNTVNTIATINATRLSSAIDKHLNPIEKLNDKLSYENIAKAQTIEYKDWKKACILSGNDTFINKTGASIFLHLGLLYYQDKEIPKVIIPNDLVPLLLACVHLKTGHGGYSRMTLALENHYFMNKDKLTREIASKCCSCQLVNTNSHKTAICQYPVPKKPFEVVALDLAEDFNNQGHYKHLLVASCMLTDGIYLFPLKSKSAQEVSHNLIYGLFQFHNVKKILSDNGPCFHSKKYTELFATLNIERIHTSRFHPASKGFVERKVRLVKDLMKKFLVSQNEQNWMGLEYIISKLLNSSKSPKTNFSPNELIFGEDHDVFEKQTLVKLHPLIKQNKESITEKHKKMMTIIENVRKKISSDNQRRNERINKHKVEDSKIRIGDLVFCKDRQIIQGNPRPLKSCFSHSPYIVEIVKFSTAQIRRLADNFTQVYSLNDLKKYEKLDPFLLQLPQAVQNILNGDFQNINPKQLKIIQENDPYNFPGGVEITDENELFIESDSDEDEDELIETNKTEIITDKEKELLETTNSPKTITTSKHQDNLSKRINNKKFKPSEQLQTINEDKTLNLRPRKKISYSK